MSLESQCSGWVLTIATLSYSTCKKNDDGTVSSTIDLSFAHLNLPPHLASEINLNTPLPSLSPLLSPHPDLKHQALAVKNLTDLEEDDLDDQQCPTYS